MISFIFGAGASFGSGGCTPKNPPLGNDLFDDLIGLKGRFSEIDNASKSVFRSEGFEAGMATIADDSRVINPLQKELACYLSAFSIRPDNAYVRLFNKLRRNLDVINITTLNYDLLIEQALNYHGFNADYNGDGRGVNLLKLHGSSNFLPLLPQGWVISGNAMIGCGTYIEGLETKAASSAEEVKEWCRDDGNSDLSPVLAMYAKGKRVVVNRNLIQRTQEKLAELIKASNLVVLVGTKYIEHDEHIWKPIEEAGSKLLIVDPYPQNTIEWAKNKNINNFIIDKSFDESVWDITKAVHREIYCSAN